MARSLESSKSIPDGLDAAPFSGHKNGSQTVRFLAVVKLTRERAGELVKLAEELEG